MSSEETREVIDVDDLDVFCTGVRQCIRIDRPPSPRCNTNLRDLLTTELQRITQAELIVRTARLNSSSPNKRALDALKMAADAVKNDLKRKEREHEVIEISSDSESEVQPPKRHRVEHPNLPHIPDHINTGPIPDLMTGSESPHVDLDPSLSSDRGHPLDDDDDSDDCINFLATLDISNEANWAPLPESNKAEDLTPKHEVESESTTSKPRPSPPPHRYQRKQTVDYHHVPTKLLLNSPWAILTRHYGLTKFPKPFFHARRQENLRPPRAPNLHRQLGYSKLALTAKYPHLTSGSVNKIIQAADTVILSAAVNAGLEDSDDDEDVPPPENKAGSLAVYYRGRVRVVPAHCRPLETIHGSVMKYYTVPDVAFNPFNSRQFLSSGYDHVIRTWEILDPDDNDERKGLNAMHAFTLDASPQELVYSPDGLALAISCLDGNVLLYRQDFFEEMIDADFSCSKKLPAAPRDVNHAAGSTLWGTGPSQQLIFTSSEPGINGRDDYRGFHHAFDNRKGAPVVQFDATESGDAAVLSPDGGTLVLFTWGRHSHPVRLYDVRRKSKEPYETEELEKFKHQPMGVSRNELRLEEVNQASFSPDGRLLAVARSDNALHVYDIRAMSRGPLCRFEHHDTDEVGGGFGIMGANWIKGRNRVGLVSGGNDGCVRLWEPMLGHSEVQGAILGRSDFEVAHFSIGDQQRGELPLVIGDSGGGMQTYQFTNEDGVGI